MANITTGKTDFQKRTIALACAEQRVTVKPTVRPTVELAVEPTTEREALNQEYLDFVEVCKEKSRAKPGKVIIASGLRATSLITVNGQTWYMRVDRVKRLWFASNGLIEAVPKSTRRALVQSLLP